MRLKTLIATAVLALVASTSMAYAGPNVPGVDTTPTLGSIPLFPTGYASDQYGNWYKQITDSTATTPAAAGVLEVFGQTAATWASSATAGQAAAPGQYGVIYTAAAAQGGAALIQVRGNANALCTTGSVAIGVGNALIADGTGNLTVPAPSVHPTAGTATPQGTTGAATVTYQTYARNSYKLDSPASANITTSTANATLSPANSVLLSGNVPAGTTEVIVVRTVGGASQGVIGRAFVAPGNTVYSYLDVGYAAGAGSYTGNTAPSFQPGQVLATSTGTLAASTASATSCPVFLGGF